MNGEEKGKEKKAGLVSIVGRPNAGKSALINCLVGEKVAIVSRVPQTTRNRIIGVRTFKEGQIVFIDTPGIHKPLHRLNKRMLDIAYAAFEGVDIVMLIIDASKRFGHGDEFVIERLSDVRCPVFLLINKIDLIRKTKILEIIERYSVLRDFKEIIPIAALTGENTDVLLREIFANLPFHPYYFPEDFLTDQPEHFFISEIIREKVFTLTREEVPHSTVVMVDKMEDKRKEGVLVIDATVHVEKDNQKGIVIGKGGELLKKIGSSAREDLERFFGTKIFLNLWVKVKKKWREDEIFLNLIFKEHGV